MKVKPDIDGTLAYISELASRDRNTRMDVMYGISTFMGRRHIGGHVDMFRRYSGGLGITVKKGYCRIEAFSVFGYYVVHNSHKERIMHTYNQYGLMDSHLEEIYTCMLDMCIKRIRSINISNASKCTILKELLADIDGYIVRRYKRIMSRVHA
jgi:hypothetical protein